VGRSLRGRAARRAVHFSCKGMRGRLRHVRACVRVGKGRGGGGGRDWEAQQPARSTGRPSAQGCWEGEGAGGAGPLLAAPHPPFAGRPARSACQPRPCPGGTLARWRARWRRCARTPPGHAAHATKPHRDPENKEERAGATTASPCKRSATTEPRKHLSSISSAFVTQAATGRGPTHRPRLAHTHRQLRCRLPRGVSGSSLRLLQLPPEVASGGASAASFLPGRCQLPLQRRHLGVTGNSTARSARHAHTCAQESRHSRPGGRPTAATA
jgi:hypothetical protein